MLRKTLSILTAAAVAASAALPAYATAPAFPAFPMSVNGCLIDALAGGVPLSGYAVRVSAGSWSGSMTTNSFGCFGGSSAYDPGLAIPEFTGALSFSVTGPRIAQPAMALRNIDDAHRADGCPAKGSLGFAPLSCRYDIDVNPEGDLDGGMVTVYDRVDVASGFVATGSTASLSGTTVVVVSQNAGLGQLSTGSGMTGVMPEGLWNGYIVAPFSTPGQRPSGAFLAAQGLGSSPMVLTSFAAGSDIGLVPVGGFFNLDVAVSASAGTVLRLFRSQDGSSWAANTPDASCTVASGRCRFRTDHLSYFAAATPTVVRSSGGGGGVSLSMDSCPNGDLSASYYDKTCAAPAAATGSVSAASVAAVRTTSLDLSGSTLPANHIKAIRRAWAQVRESVQKSAQPSTAAAYATDFFADARVALKGDHPALEIHDLAEMAKADIAALGSAEPAVRAPSKVAAAPRVSYVAPSPAGVSAPAAPVPAAKASAPKSVAVPAFADGAVVFVRVDRAINVRAAADFKSRVTANFRRNQPVTVLESAAGWSKVEVAGKSGWLRGEYLAAEPDVRTAPAALSVYAKWDFSDKPSFTVPSGAAVTVVNVLPKALEIEAAGKSGFVRSSDLK